MRVGCKRSFPTYRVLNQHLRFCLLKTRPKENLVPSSQPVLENEVTTRSSASYQFQWGDIPGNEFVQIINKAYEKIVFWRKNLFKLPSGSAGKRYISEITKLLNGWTFNSPWKDISFKAIHIMPGLLLQKPSKNSKAKDHANALRRRLILWLKGDIESLLHEAETIQKRLKTIHRRKDIGQISKSFAAMMKNGNVNGALKLSESRNAGFTTSKTSRCKSSSRRNFVRWRKNTRTSCDI